MSEMQHPHGARNSSRPFEDFGEAEVLENAEIALVHRFDRFLKDRPVAVMRNNYLGRRQLDGDRLNTDLVPHQLGETEDTPAQLARRQRLDREMDLYGLDPREVEIVGLFYDFLRLHTRNLRNWEAVDTSMGNQLDFLRLLKEQHPDLFYRLEAPSETRRSRLEGSLGDARWNGPRP